MSITLNHTCGFNFTCILYKPFLLSGYSVSTTEVASSDVASGYNSTAINKCIINKLSQFLLVSLYVDVSPNVTLFSTLVDLELFAAKINLQIGLLL